MGKSLIIFTTAIFALILFSEAKCDEEECTIDRLSRQDTKFLISVTKNSSGDWVSWFSAEKSVGNKTDGVSLLLKQSVFKCGEKNVIKIKGFVRNVPVLTYSEEFLTEHNVNMDLIDDSALWNEPKEKESFKFQEKKGKNAMLLKNGRTAYRKNANSNVGYAGLVTNRPLKDDELFQVSLDKIQDTRIGSLLFGVTQIPPADIESRKHFQHYKNGTWLLLWNYLEKDGTKITENYGLDLTKVNVGDRIGVKKKSNGDLHFYLNGKDMGLAASGVLSTVYGVIDVNTYVEQVSIVD